jgi:hypothetical protein
MNLLNNNEFLPEIYYSFYVHDKKKINTSDFNAKTLLINNNVFINLNNYHFDCILGLNEFKKYKIKSNLINNYKISYISNVELCGQFNLKNFFYLHDCIIDSLNIIDNTIYNNISDYYLNNNLIFNNCFFKNPINVSNLTNILFQDCNIIEYNNLNIINLVYLNTHIKERFYIYNQQSAILNVILNLYKNIQTNYLNKPLLIYKNKKYYIKIIKNNISSYHLIDYCISPGIKIPKNYGIDIYSFLTNPFNKNFIFIPNGIYYLDKPILLNASIIGIGLPLINFIINGQIILKKSNIIIEGLKIHNYTNNNLIILLENNNTLMNLIIQNEKKNNNLNSLILVYGNFNFLNNICLLNHQKNYEYGLINMGNYNLFISIYMDVFKKCNFYNLGLNNDIIYLNNEVVQNYGIISKFKLIVLGCCFISFCVHSLNYKLTDDSIIKNSYILYLDDYKSIYESKLLYFPYFINFDKTKKEECKIKKIKFDYFKNSFLLNLTSD